ncbi:phospho-sugar mutase [uncultured Vagococcus sp.]|uniref:phospho-sugar mutase n=1 Tax=uncultured Vagococcus sp. TaxID=189676 RepID=UPI0028D87DC6|nr:phospho-sugar mutase [uncultured Vagococcus sp.]
MEKNQKKWLDSMRIDNQLKKQLTEATEDQLNDMFYQDLPFGTGGMRGLIGIGTNRMNLLTVAKATRGLAQYLLMKYADLEQPAVVIGYDNRLYSKEFAEHTAEVLAGFQIKVYLFKDIAATPLVSFGVRQLNAQGGIVITASHNPPEYNGYKIYDETGCQMLPKEIAKVIDCIENSGDFFAYSTSRQGITYLDQRFQNRYIKELAGIATMVETSKKLTIGFSPQHGTSREPVKEMLADYGFNEVVYVQEQMAADPFFSQTESANPEDVSAYDLLIDYGRKYDLDVLITTDPDADRVGVVYKDRLGDYQLLSGNQLGALLIDFFIKFKQRGPDSYIVKTIVTSELGAEIAKAHGVQVENVLTGFKYIGDVINQKGEAGFIGGYEESFGYLMEPLTRDKDGIQIVLSLVVMANYYLDHQQTLGDRLTALFNEYGFYEERLISWTLAGRAGQQTIKRLYEQFKQLPLIDLAYTEDYELGVRRYSSESVPLEFEQALVVKHVLEDGSWLCARPSGTEPKLKLYLGTNSPTKEISAAKIANLVTMIDQNMKPEKEE